MSIIRKEAYFTSCNGVNQIRVLIWQDEQKTPVAVVQIAHGVAEHIGRYDEFARFLAAEGFVVCGNDHLGHGRSVLSEELLGMVEYGDHVNMLRDMNTLHRIMAKRFPGGRLVFDTANKRAVKIMLKTWVKDAGITSISDYFAVNRLDDLAWMNGAAITSRGYMLGYNDLKDPSVPGVFRLLAKLGDGFMKMQIVRMEFDKED